MYIQNTNLALHHQTIKNSPTSALAYKNLGELLLGFSKVSEAVKCLQLSVSLDPNLGEAHFLLGQALAEQGQWQDSIYHYQKALSLKASQPSFIGLELANSLEQLNFLNEAVEACEKAIRISCNDTHLLSRLYEKLGSILLKQDKSDLSISAYQKAIEFNHQSSSAHYGLSVALEKSGNINESIAYFQKASNLGYSLEQVRLNPFNLLQTINCWATKNIWSQPSMVSLFTPSNSEHREARLEKLHDFFDFFSVRSRNLPQDWWNKLIDVWQYDSKKRESVMASLIKCIDSIPATQFEVYEWIQFYSMCLRIGLFTLGYSLRQKARVRALYLTSLQEATEQNLKLYITSATEISKFDLVHQGLKALESCYGKSIFWGFYYWLTSLIMGEESNTIPQKYIDFSQEGSNDFLDLISGRSVAVVGPLPTAARDAEEIDSFDIVIRINHRQNGIGCDSLHKGLRCDIAYFNVEQFKNLLVEHDGQLPQYLKWAVLKSSCSGSPEIVDEVKSRNPTVKMRFSKPHDDSSFLLNGQGNMLQIIILDLLHFQPSQIKVFHADLMLTPKRFTGYYPEQFQRNQEREIVHEFLSISPMHDPVTLYELTANLWRAGLIDGDSQFCHVMDLGCEEYMEQLEQAYKLVD